MESERQNFGAGQIVHGPGYILKTAPAQELKKNWLSHGSAEFKKTAPASAPWIFHKRLRLRLLLNVKLQWINSLMSLN